MPDLFQHSLCDNHTRSQRQAFGSLQCEQVQSTMGCDVTLCAVMQDNITRHENSGKNV